MMMMMKTDNVKTFKTEEKPSHVSNTVYFGLKLKSICNILRTLKRVHTYCTKYMYTQNAQQLTIFPT